MNTRELPFSEELLNRAEKDELLDFFKKRTDKYADFFLCGCALFFNSHVSEQNNKSFFVRFYAFSTERSMLYNE